MFLQSRSSGAALLTLRTMETSSAERCRESVDASDANLGLRGELGYSPDA